MASTRACCRLEDRAGRHVSSLPCASARTRTTCCRRPSRVGKSGAYARRCACRHQDHLPPPGELRASGRSRHSAHTKRSVFLFRVVFLRRPAMDPIAGMCGRTQSYTPWSRASASPPSTRREPRPRHPHGHRASRRSRARGARWARHGKGTIDERGFARAAPCGGAPRGHPPRRRIAACTAQVRWHVLLSV